MWRTAEVCDYFLFLFLAEQPLRDKSECPSSSSWLPGQCYCEVESHASCRQQLSATAKRIGSICKPSFGDSGEFCWAVPIARYYLGSWSEGVVQETMKGPSQRSSPGFQGEKLDLWFPGQESQAFIFHCTLSTLPPPPFFFSLKKQNKRTPLAFRPPPKFSGHGQKEREYWNLR